ncbi:MAG: rhomboid family intramembrane serine protease, partial [Actinobacteria bacterium]|nr:rhomboid family intramembrane serine protease [Actinomycetota bacterium]
MVLPVRDVNPHRRTPVVTYALIAVNLVVFLLSPIATSFLTPGSVDAQCEQLAFLYEFAAIPDELVDDTAAEVVPTGDARGDQCVGAPPDYDKQPWLSVLFAMFLHGGWLHLLGNMLFLYVFGDNVEDRLGRV